MRGRENTATCHLVNNIYPNIAAPSNATRIDAPMMRRSWLLGSTRAVARFMAR